MLITFEGGEGCGKSTHVKLLEEYLKSKGREVVVTHEPGSTQLGKGIREMLLSRETEIEPLSEIFLFAADRLEHVEQVIKPALNSGKIVVCDRFTDSTLAYQLGGRGLPEDLVRYINWISCRGLVPDLTILLDIDVKEGLKRATLKGKDRFESEIMAFHERVRDKYIEMAKDDPSRVSVIESYEDVGKVQKEIQRIVSEKL